MQLLLISSSKVGDSGYLEDAKHQLVQHFKAAKNLVFVPYAGVSISWDEYTDKVKSALPSLPITGLHQHADPCEAVKESDGILVGGGNTFHLLNTLYELSLGRIIYDVVNCGTPYAGWSAGANIAGRSIRTTNDMPIVQPPSFDALQLVPFQINPHYTDFQPPGHHGETREDRLREFMTVSPEMPIVGIPEGVALYRVGDSLRTIGGKSAYLFRNQEKSEITPEQDISFLLNPL